ncbi:hypothetical protein GCM10007973_19790 [Polymorphobacter multimanifer]|uniref:REDY-like protein HapK n=1 Tax=Polymorphobacter multimanifer TaxID=1070431 RepID=A0A841L3T1_9SPHN|nr:REDY-like protein HapK [Polymorphobacter multimanifer]MBB6227317.1 hypothetical protein [Polymorphobacter multimanifer]GGI83338.1 hypothetical protein GCM10007973_19790 [Polymorphobacter multimanifer]
MRMFVMFNLKPGVEVADYEEWTKTRDMPNVRSLMSIKDFRVFGVTGLFGSDAKPPFQYVEVIDIVEIDEFLKDIDTPAMKEVTGEFEKWTDSPVFLTTNELLVA